MFKAAEQHIFTQISITMFAILQVIHEENEVVAAKTTCPYPPPSFLQTLRGVDPSARTRPARSCWSYSFPGSTSETIVAIWVVFLKQC